MGPAAAVYAARVQDDDCGSSRQTTDVDETPQALALHFGETPDLEGHFVRHLAPFASSAS
jgi:hypothetical protein